MADMAHEWTDAQIEAIGKRMRSVYEKAKKEVAPKLSEMLADYESENLAWQESVADGTSTQEEYEDWLNDMAYDLRLTSEVADSLAEDATKTNRDALVLASAAILLVFSENVSMAAYEVERGVGYSTGIYDSLSREVTKLSASLPKVGASKDKDFAWNRKKALAVVVSAILAGSSVSEIAKRMTAIYDMNGRYAKNSMVTAMTGAESMGRLESYQSALAAGIPVEKQWVAVLDNRTRMTHRELDGQRVPLDEPFTIESTGETIRFPGDPNASPQEVYNCRCSLEVVISGKTPIDLRIERLPKGLTYEQWKSGKWVGR